MSHFDIEVGALSEAKKVILFDGDCKHKIILIQNQQWWVGGECSLLIGEYVGFLNENINLGLKIIIKNYTWKKNMMVANIMIVRKPPNALLYFSSPSILNFIGAPNISMVFIILVIDLLMNLSNI